MDVKVTALSVPILRILFNASFAVAGSWILSIKFPTIFDTINPRINWPKIITGTTFPHRLNLWRWGIRFVDSVNKISLQFDTINPRRA